MFAICALTRVQKTPQSLIEFSIDRSVPGFVLLQHENASEQLSLRGVVVRWKHGFYNRIELAVQFKRLNGCHARPLIVVELWNIP